MDRTTRLSAPSLQASGTGALAARWLLRGPLLTAIVFGLTEGVSKLGLRIPNPPALLVLTIVVSAFWGGLRAGLLSAALAWVYAAYFFSVPEHPFRYSDENLLRVLVWAVTMPATAVLVGTLKGRADRLAAALLRREQSYAAAVVASLSDGLAVLGLEGEVLELNERLREITGFPAEEVIGRPALASFWPRDEAESLTRLLQKTREGATWEQEVWLRRRGGKSFPAAVTFSALRNEMAEVAGVVATVKDVTERRQAEQALRESESRYRLLFERNLAGVYRNTLDGRILDCNDACARILGFASGEELLAQRAQDVYFDALDRKSVLRGLQLHKTLTNVEARLRRRDGTAVWVLENMTLLEGEGQEGPVIEGTLVDITDRKRAEEQVAHQAYHDSLTGLPNRALFRDRLQLALTHGKRHRRRPVVLYLDLDHFKRVNDTLGHATGDELLQIVATRLKGCLRQGDTVTRMGGDEFALLLPDLTTEGDATRLAQKILEAVSRPLPLGTQEMVVTASIGIAVYPKDGKDADTLLRSADGAMYRVKERGRNGYQVCTQELGAPAQDRLSLENDLRRALERGELLLHYQPIVELGAVRVVAQEALLRWNHPERGLLYPDAFLALAEEAGLLVHIGDWVLRTACRQACAWQLPGQIEQRVAVNICGQQLQQGGLVSVVRAALGDTGCRPSLLVLEITESAAMQNLELVRSTLGQLRETGVGISIDDFGTGYSSLSHLKHLPVDSVKIDKAFVRDLASDEGDAAIVSAVIAMAHSLRLTVVAEGVETPEQLDFLRQRGCDLAQGYLFGRPVPAAPQPGNADRRQASPGAW